MNVTGFRGQKNTAVFLVRVHFPSDGYTDIEMIVDTAASDTIIADYECPETIINNRAYASTRRIVTLLGPFPSVVVPGCQLGFWTQDGQEYRTSPIDLSFLKSIRLSNWFHRRSFKKVFGKDYGGKQGIIEAPANLLGRDLLTRFGLVLLPGYEPILTTQTEQLRKSIDHAFPQEPVNWVTNSNASGRA